MMRARLFGRADWKPARTRTLKAAAGAKRILIATGAVVFRVVAFITFRRRHGLRGRCETGRAAGAGGEV